MCYTSRSFSSTYVQVCRQLRNLRFFVCLRKIAKIARSMIFRVHLRFFAVVSLVNDIMHHAPINVNPVGGRGVRARGGDLTAKSIPSVGGLIEYLRSGVGAFDFFDRETGTKIKRGYMASSFLALKSPVVS